MEWIPVNVSLPRIDECVLVYLDYSGVDPDKNNMTGGEVGYGFLQKYYSSDKPEWCVFHNKNYKYYGVIFDDSEKTWGKVTHWMQTPKAP